MGCIFLFVFTSFVSCGFLEDTMESFVDITTTAFEAILAVCVVFTAGYAYNGKHGVTLSSTLTTISKDVLLPCLVFSTLAGSSWLTWHRILQFWPSLVLVLTCHLASLAVGLAISRVGNVSSWMTETLAFNNVSSYPLLLAQALNMISSDGSQGGLAHLKWRTMDSTSVVSQRLTVYLVINILVTSLGRFVLLPVIQRIQPPVAPLGEEINGDSESLDDAEADLEEPTERTPLVAYKAPSPASYKFFVTPLLIAVVLGLFIGLIKPLQRLLIGDGWTERTPSGLWQSIGYGIILLGTTFAVVDMIGVGASLRAVEASSINDKQPPALGSVLIVTFWRLVCIPIISVSIVYGLRKIPSTKFFLYDPAYSFALVISNVSPPALPLVTAFTPFRSAVTYYTYYVSLISALAVAAAIAISGRGVSYEDNFDIVRALKSAGGGGLAGAAAMVLQVLTLMPMRTIMNYQYRYGGSIKGAVTSLWNDGGFPRYYAGLGAALFQGPLSRFGDTAANAGILALLESLTWPVLIKTVVGSLCAATFRMALTPIDTLKTTQQTRGGKAGIKLLRERIAENGVGCLWWGALATAAATFVGNYPWFGTYNYLGSILPPPHNMIQKLARQAFIGFVASVVSDTVSNSLRVVKTYRQVNERDVGYWTAAKEIVESDGVLALFGRGLPTRLITNGLQGLLFSMLWKLFTDIIAGKGGKA
ncbi:mitochondrial carrier domain-containing protein [Naematelia encephala]|uniref:Mitochondrial carrier domain-containing protein n=1 Tax=Naematelia encephala TaxID=71784 RepID=A0A1Y2AMC6_9TREE|nr:mitochondrial carrier domain-containing protein [Naematelia encephala]